MFTVKGVTGQREQSQRELAPKSALLLNCTGLFKKKSIFQFCNLTVLGSECTLPLEAFQDTAGSKKAIGG